MNGKKRRRRSVPIVNFVIHPLSGEMFALDARGNMWVGGRESIDGRTHIAWSKMGGLPFEEEADVEEPGDDDTKYYPPQIGGRHD